MSTFHRDIAGKTVLQTAAGHATFLNFSGHFIESIRKSISCISARMPNFVKNL